MTETELYQLLVKCMPVQLDVITVALQLNEAFLPGRSDPVATRASEILRLARQRGTRGLTDLERAVNEVLGRKPAPKRPKNKRVTDRVAKTDTSRSIPVIPSDPGAAAPSSTRPASDTPPVAREQLRTIRIFLASSEELREDRDAFELYLRQLNDHFRKQGLYLEINRWENFLDAMSETRLQDEYNEAVRNCDIFVSLFFTKTGKFTEEEFDTAHRQFEKTKRPLIYTFFKNADIKTGSARAEDLNSLWAFKEKLKDLGHFYTGYDHTEHLKRLIRDQLDKLLADKLLA